MAREVEHIEIQGPPIDEIQKRSSCLKQGCTTLLFLMCITLGVLILGINVLVKPHTKKSHDVPVDFPSHVPLYDKENADTITSVSGKQRKQAIDLLAFVPKAILSPLIGAIENAENITGTESPRLWESFIQSIGDPSPTYRNMVTVEWSDLQANPKFLQTYYQSTLEDAGFKKSEESRTYSQRFVDDTHVTVILEILDDTDTQNGTAYAILRVYYPST